MTLGQRFQPGFLFSPLGWTAPWLLSAVDQKPALRPYLVNLTPSRMHLVGVILAHCDEPPHSELAEVALCASASKALKFALGWQPAGLRGAISNIQPWVLEKVSYQALLDLLKDPQMVTLLAQAEHLAEQSLVVLKDLPPSLRRAAFALQWSLSSGFVDGLRLLAERSPFRTYEALIADLEVASDRGQLMAKIRKIVEDLPLQTTLPPENVGLSRRIDHPAEIRRLAKQFRNCLENFVRDVGCGLVSIYLWEDRGERAVALARRYGRLGWFFEEAKGPNNSELPSSLRRRIRTAFEDCGVLSASAAIAIETFVEQRMDRFRTPRQRQLALEGDNWGDMT